MINVLWGIVAVLFMLSIFFFGVMFYLTLQRIKIIGIKREVISIDKNLRIIRGNITRLLNQFQKFNKNK